MAYTRELTEEEKAFCLSLGGIVIFWNHIETSMRMLIERATHIGEQRHRIRILVSNLGNVALSEAMTAIADDHSDDLKPHFKHCAALFDSERVYRNYYVHNPTTFLTRGEETHALAQHTTAKGGALKLHQAEVSRAQLEAFHDRLSALQNYINELLANSIGKGGPLASLEMPPLPGKLELHRLRLIGTPPPPRS